MAALLVATGCAPRSGWQRTDQVCQRADPPRICFEADPDAPLTLEVGSVTLVPGECAEAPRGRTALLRYTVVDGRAGRIEERVGIGRARALVVTAFETDEGLQTDTNRVGCP
ncbi:MAG: hypothetical protein ACE37F_26365 [Nannocystaceae bacterium]|nr:hypothetical protein [bacterium]